MKDDTISRAAAIALVEEVESKRLKGEIDLTYVPMIKGIKALPPAQPDCTDCIKHGGDWECDHKHCRKGQSVQSELEKKILEIGYTGKEGRFYIGGRLFAVRELPQ